MTSTDLVLAVRHDEHQREVDGAPAEHGDDVDRGVIRPVGVLDDEQHRSVRADAGDEIAEQRVAVRGRHHVKGAGGVDERPEGSWGSESIAAPERDAHIGVDAVGEMLDQRCLADPRLAADEHDPTAAARRRDQCRVESFELVVALEHLDHRPRL